MWAMPTGFSHLGVACFFLHETPKALYLLLPRVQVLDVDIGVEFDTVPDIGIGYPISESATTPDIDIGLGYDTGYRYWNRLRHRIRISESISIRYR